MAEDEEEEEGVVKNEPFEDDYESQVGIRCVSSL